MEGDGAHIDVAGASSPGHIASQPGHIEAHSGNMPDPDAKVKEWAELAAEKKRLEDQLKAIKPRMQELEEVVLGDFAERSVKSIHIKGIGKVGTRRELWAKPKRAGGEATDEEKLAAAQALKDAGLGDYVVPKYDTRTISRLYREWEEEGVDPPKELEDYWEAEKGYKLTLRKD